MGVSINLATTKEDSGIPESSSKPRAFYFVRPTRGTFPGTYLPSPEVISSIFFFWCSSPVVNNSIFLASSVSILASPM